ncbi:hypothetical protein D1007_57263 [Hordeum vulgare]|nr:hypothetical protein D1007_57263 [Hordeum vulgare]
MSCRIPATRPSTSPQRFKRRRPRVQRSHDRNSQLAKLDMESAKRRNQRAVQKANVEHATMEVARHKANVDEKEASVNKTQSILMLGGASRQRPSA